MGGIPVEIFILLLQMIVLLLKLYSVVAALVALLFI